MISPMPEHSGQAEVVDMTPKAVRDCTRTEPEPPQRLQTSDTAYLAARRRFSGTNFARKILQE